MADFHSRPATGVAALPISAVRVHSPAGLFCNQRRHILQTNRNSRRIRARPGRGQCGTRAAVRNAAARPAIFAAAASRAANFRAILPGIMSHNGRPNPLKWRERN